MLMAEAGDEGAQAQLSSTVPQSVFLFDAYLVLSQGAADGKILLSEITNYADFLGITSDNQRTRFVRAIQSLAITGREIN